MMKDSQIKAFYQLCDILEIRKFTPEEVKTAFINLKTAILIGLKRRGEKKTEDAGLAAIDSTIKPINLQAFIRLPSGTKVLYGAYAGTNWITGVAFKLDKNVIEQKLVVRSFANKSERRFASPAAFAQMIAEQIQAAITALNGDKSISTLAVSFGFPQLPKNTFQGRDAVVTTEHLTKSWYIKGGANMMVGKSVLAHLKKIGLKSLRKIYFANDTTAVALDVTAKYAASQAEDLVSLPVGFVMGTGDNASAVFKGYKHNHLVNLEIGMAHSFGEDQILKLMRQEQLIPTTDPIIEYYMGGDYLLARLACAMRLLRKHKKGMTKFNYYRSLLKYAQEAKLTSKLAARDITAKELSELLHLKVSSDDLFILNEVAKRILFKASQVAGAMVASVCEVAGWGQGIAAAIPIEGTVFSQAFGFREGVRRTLKALIPHHRLVFVPGSGTRGIATEAMIRER